MGGVREAPRIIAAWSQPLKTGRCFPGHEEALRREMTWQWLGKWKELSKCRAYGRVEEVEGIMQSIGPWSVFQYSASDLEHLSESDGEAFKGFVVETEYVGFIFEEDHWL